MKVQLKRKTENIINYFIDENGIIYNEKDEIQKLIYIEIDHILKEELFINM